ncbi:glycosyltransferase [Cellulomonas pakistanensis]|uniref:Glycosyltransferase 2-like domain-containing protein n=1 Tax=Cellulomonas pakistanensis TaxID=992287 RepID=A0A919U2Z7_9CELL|nr:glycosyltransferase [Cellulomonas pakistanensis]GIG36623.1 hypothetical protein Cpa01nite_20040 [Cellulomonas pakistanensis]
MPDALSARADVSVVVVAGGSEPALAGTLDTVTAALRRARRGPAGPGALRGERLGGEVVLVVGDVSALPAALRARIGDRFRVVAAPGVGRARARNVGVAAARGRYLLFTEPGARVPEDWVLAVTAPLRAGAADLVGGPARVVAPGRAGPVPDAAASAVLGAVRVPGRPGRPWSGVSLAVTRAVLEAVGFDEALGGPRYRGGEVAAFVRDVVGAGFRAATGDGEPVLRPVGPRALARGALVERARARGRVDAYLDRHLHDARPRPLAGRLAVAARALRVAGLVVGRRPAAAVLDAHADLARRRELLRLRAADVRVPPRSAAGDAPGGSGAPRASRPVALVVRDRGAPVPLPSEAATAATGPAPAAPDAGRGSVYALWGAGRSLGGAARASAARVEPIQGTTAS